MSLESHLGNKLKVIFKRFAQNSCGSMQLFFHSGRLYKVNRLHKLVSLTVSEVGTIVASNDIACAVNQNQSKHTNLHNSNRKYKNNNSNILYKISIIYSK